MRNIFFACILGVSAAVPAFCDQGCVEMSTTTVTTTSCLQFDCIQESNGDCVMWSCQKTQVSKYIDVNNSGCTRVANCGKKALFKAGLPDDPEVDSSEVCDWYPCVQADPSSKACWSYLCVSKRVFQTIHTTYSNALCVPLAAPGLLTLPSGKKMEQGSEIQPTPVNMPRLK